MFHEYHNHIYNHKVRFHYDLEKKANIISLNLQSLHTLDKTEHNETAPTLPKKT